MCLFTLFSFCARARQVVALLSSSYNYVTDWRADTGGLAEYVLSRCSVFLMLANRETESRPTHEKLPRASTVVLREQEQTLVLVTQCHHILVPKPSRVGLYFFVQFQGEDVSVHNIILLEISFRRELSGGAT